MFEGYSWLNEPPRWRETDGELTLATAGSTDFWQTTFYGFRRDDGHAFLQPVDGDFTLTLSVRGDYRALYDQAGAMLRVDEKNWIKTGIEFTDGLMHFSVVVTRAVSDWSVIPLPGATPADQVHLRLSRHGEAVRVQYAVGEKPTAEAAWRMARLAFFPGGPARAGLMACSPERAGFEAAFRDVAIGPPVSSQLHAE